MIDQDGLYGAAQQSPPEEITTPVQKPIEDKSKEHEPSQTIEPAGGAAMSAHSVDALPRVNQ